MKIDVGIVNYNAGACLRQCLSALVDDPAVGHIYIVDNASDDDSLEDLANLPAGSVKVHVIRNDRNRGYAHAVNQFINLAQAEFLLILNPDCVVDPGTLTAVRAVLDADPKVGMAGGLLKNPDGSEQRGGRRRLPDLSSSLRRLIYGQSHAERGFDLVNTPLPEYPVEVEAISGAFMLVRRAAVSAVGLMDEGYFLHCEDLDWCMRFRQKGWKILFVPTASVVHDQGVSSRSRPVFVLWHKHRGMWRFYSKFYRAHHSVPLNVLVWFGVWSRFYMLALPAALSGLLGRRV
ncbi:MAG: glycosyltransferase family 2 protein [Gammaproteobacteria bacterium]